MKTAGMVLTILGLSLVAATSSAGPNAGASLVLHITDPTASDRCLTADPLPMCQRMVTGDQRLGVPFYVYIMVQKGDVAAGIGGASLGIDYGPGFNIMSWNLCADSQTTFNWPASGSGLRVSWNPDNCQHRMTGTGDPFWDGGAAVVGYFYCSAYQPVSLSIFPHPQDNKAEIVDCTGTVDDIAAIFPSHLGAAGFGGAIGYNPCYAIDAYPCVIRGPANCSAGSAGNVYTMGDLGSVQWDVSGNGSIVGPADQHSVTVQAGAPGTFTIACGGTGMGGGGFFCSRIITVQDAVPTTPTSWSGIKTLYRN